MVYFRIKHTIFMLTQETAEAVGMVVTCISRLLEKHFYAWQKAPKGFEKHPYPFSYFSVLY